MNCQFLKVGSHKHCESKPKKNSKYCTLHTYLMKTSKVKPCLNCGKGTSAKYQICVPCGAHKIRLKHQYYEIEKPLREEFARLSRILI